MKLNRRTILKTKVIVEAKNNWVKTYLMKLKTLAYLLWIISLKLELSR